MQLLTDNSVVRVDGANNGRCEERKALNSNVVEQEDCSSAESHGGEDALENLLAVELVQNFGSSDSLRLDTRDCQVLFFLGKPFCGCRSVRHSDESNESQADGDDTLDGEDHSPSLEASKAVQLQDSRRQQPTKGSSKGGSNDVKSESPGQFASSIPSGEVVGDTRKHTRLEDAEDESDSTHLAEGVDVASGNRTETESQRDTRDEPSRTNPFAGHVCWDFTDDVADIEDG